MAHYTLGTAANACGLNKSTVLCADIAVTIAITRRMEGATAALWRTTTRAAR